MTRSKNNFRLFSFVGFLFALIFFVPPIKATANICLHPLEQAALLHGKPKTALLKDRIKKANRKLGALEKEIERKETAVDDAKDDLAEQLKEGADFVPAGLEVNNQKGASAAAEVIHDYIDEKKDSLEEEITKKWDPSEYLKSKGKVKERDFCKKYAQDKRRCERAIDRLEKRLERLAEMEELQAKLEELINDLEDEQEFGGEEDETEASGLCFTCLDELRELDQPSTGQVVGNILSLAAGGAMSYFGYKAGRREAQRTNVLRLRQGYDPVSHHGLSWAGASLGLPFISNGIYGLSGGNSRFGSFACGPGHAGGHNMYGPFAYNQMAGAQFQMGAGNQFYNPMSAQAQFQMGAGNQFYNPQAQFQMGAGNQFYNPMAAGAQLQFGAGNQFYNPQAQFQMGAGNQFYNPMAAGAQLQFGAGNQFYNPMSAQAQFQMGAGNQFYNPMAAGAQLQFGARNPYVHGGMRSPMMPNMAMQYRQQQYTQYMQFQQQQMQARIKMQQAWLQHQIAVQKDWANRQQVIGSLTQEIHKIQQQIQLVASGGGASNSSLTSGASFSAGISVGTDLAGSPSGPQGTSQGPPSTGSGRSSEGVIEGR